MLIITSPYFMDEFEDDSISILDILVKVNWGIMELLYISINNNFIQ